MTEDDAASPMELARSLKGKLVRFNHEREGGPVRLVTDISPDAMVALSDMGGWFAPHLFTVADDVAGVPPDLSSTRDTARIKAVGEAYLAAEYDGNVTVESMRQRYGDGEANSLQYQINHNAKNFLAMFDAAMAFPVPKKKD